MLHDKVILVVTDDADERRDLSTVLSFIGEQPSACDYKSWLDQSCDELDTEAVGLVILGSTQASPDLGAFLKHCHSIIGEVPVFSVGFKTELASALEPLLKRMLIDNFDASPCYSLLNDAIHRAQCYNEAVQARKELRDKRPVHLFRSLVGTSRQVQNVRNMMSQVADNDVTVLIEGESGTGKEVVARNLHYHSDRRDGPFVPVNCGAIPAELLESELFGHEKGAFTGAVSARAGRFEMAEGGTLFLDEIGDMPLHMQVKILRVLQERTFERVGGNKTYETNVRIIAATHRNLEKMIEEGDFREDLYYRLNVFPIEMPSLRERSEDIPLLVNELVKRLESEGRGSIRFSSSAVISLCRHAWPGNVRELANLVERMAIMRPFSVVGVQDLPRKYRYVDAENEFEDLAAEEEQVAPAIVGVGGTVLLPEGGIDLKEYISDLEQNFIQQALDNNAGVVARAADQLSIRRTTLVEKMRKYGMQR